MVLITLALVSLVVTACSSLIKKHPVPFYALALALDAVYLFFRFFASYSPLVLSALQVMQKGLIAYALFVVVMFIGALDESSRLRARLYPIRGELSLLGCLFVLGHVGGYLTSYLMTLLRDSGVIPPSVLASILVSLASLVLLLVLGFTTFTFVRSRMNPTIWKRIQRLSYPFFGLIHVHLALMLVPTMRNDAAGSALSLAVYAVVLIAYVFARLVRPRLKRAR
ncbi:MAG: ferric reductase-like transmembrane domain-containing protein [Coriobacteriales bacterium]|jgi:DMSO/TMAO reductase YedYZ heme-binding membrane subunit|nr:ferric reductase-like transmembrane domain-containing protein [Coriobacteriales bacterium]